MAEKNQKKITEFEKEMIDTAKKVVEFKVAAEANVVSILYKTPDKFRYQADSAILPMLCSE